MSLDPNSRTSNIIIIDDASADLIDFNILNVVVVIVINGEVRKPDLYSV